MGKEVAYAVFVFPVVFTVVFSTAVLAGALDTLDRELNMWPGGSHQAHLSESTIVITGLHAEYTESDTIEFQVRVDETQYDCGTLDIEMYNSIGEMVEKHTYESQCFADESLLPLEGFTALAGPPDIYTLTITISNNENQLLTSAVFNVR